MNNMREYKTWETRNFFVGLGMVILIFCIGVIGFIGIEGYTFLDAVYMSVLTISTVGFGEVHPLSDLGKIFASVLILSSIGVIGYVLTTVSRLLLDGYFRMKLKDYHVKKKIEKLKDHVIVCGYGRNGFQACQELQDHEESFIIIEERDHVVEEMKKNESLLYVQGSASSEEVLTQARIHEARALITALPNDADNVFVVLTAREMNPKLKIISRASSFRSDLKLKRAGADNIVMPDRIGGQSMAKLVMQEDVVEFMEYIMMQSCKSVTVSKIPCAGMCDELNGKSLRELGVKGRFGANIIGLKDEQGEYVFNPPADYVLTRSVDMFILGTPREVDNLRGFIEGGNACVN